MTMPTPDKCFGADLRHAALRIGLAGIGALCVCASALAQIARADMEPPVAGEIIAGFEMVPNRTVIFQPLEDGSVKILKADDDRHAPMPRNPGQVAVSLTYALEIGAVLEFNSGLDHAFTYRAFAAPDPATDASLLHPLETCSVGPDRVSSDQWPQPFKRIVITGVARHAGPPTC